MKINVMRKGDKFIGLTNDKILLEDEKGDVRIIRLIEDEDGICIDPEEIIIAHGNGTIVMGNMDEGIEVTNF